MESGSRVREAYFAASNSEKGFFSYYEELFRPGEATSMLYIIKGGPGCGKSRLLWDMVRTGEARGCAATLFYCSSDPASLDAVILRREDGTQIVALDGTAPHEMQPRIPGVQEQLIDLGTFWSCRQLRAQRESIQGLMAEKTEHYAAAYRDLAAAGLCEQTASELIGHTVDHRALSRLCERLVSGAVGTSGRGQRQDACANVRTVCTRAIGMRGRTQLDTLTQQADRVCHIEPYYGVEYRLMNALVQALTVRGEQITVSRHPVFPTYADGIWLPQHGVAFVTDMTAPSLTEDQDQAMPSSEESCYTRSISPRRAVDRARLQMCRARVRHAVRQREALIADAERELMAAASPHFALEAIYGAAMNFDAKEAYSRAVCEEIFRE